MFVYNVMRLHCIQRFVVTNVSSKFLRAKFAFLMQHLVNAVFLFISLGVSQLSHWKCEYAFHWYFPWMNLIVFVSSIRFAFAAHTKPFLRDASCIFSIRHVLTTYLFCIARCAVATCTRRIRAWSALVANLIKVFAVCVLTWITLQVAQNKCHASSASSWLKRVVCEHCT